MAVLDGRDSHVIVTPAAARRTMSVSKKHANKRCPTRAFCRKLLRGIVESACETAALREQAGPPLAEPHSLT